MGQLVPLHVGLHNWPYPETPSGSVGTRAGTIMAGFPKHCMQFLVILL
jgi:hypothetical protein